MADRAKASRDRGGDAPLPSKTVQVPGALDDDDDVDAAADTVGDPVPNDPMLGTVIEGRFTMLQEIGAGGMGKVYRARQLSVGRDVAVKVLHPRLVSDSRAAKRFLKEARIVSSLRHPNTVTVFDFGETAGGALFMAMELLHGRPLSKAAEAGQMTIERVAHILGQVCDSLSEAHGLGLVHRDLKPENIFILEGEGHRDTVKVLDFGIARLSNGEGTKITSAGGIVGTPTYMSPEQIQGKPVDRRSDIYSLGVVMYELLAGAPPFVAKTVPALYLQHVMDVPARLETKNPNVPRAAADLVAAMLAKDCDDRPQTTGEIRTALSALAAARPFELTPTKRRRRADLVRYAVAAVGVVALVCLAVFWPYADGESSRDGQPIGVIVAKPTTNLGVPSVPPGSSDSRTQRLPEAVRLAMPALPTDPGAKREPGPATGPSNVTVHMAAEPPGATLWLGTERMGPSPQVRSLSERQLVGATVRAESAGYVSREVSLSLATPDPADRRVRRLTIGLSPESPALESPSVVTAAPSPPVVVPAAGDPVKKTKHSTKPKSTLAAERGLQR